MTKTQYVGQFSSSCGADDAIATHRVRDTSKIYFFANGTATLREGYISVTRNVCDEGVGISLINDSPYQNRRLRCPRASKHSQPSASSQSSQHAAASKKKKLLSLSQLLLNQHTTNTKTTFAGRAFRIAPQNPTGLTAQPARAAHSIFNSDTRLVTRARATRSHARVSERGMHDIRSKVTPC